jgi:ribosomal protein L10
MKTKRSAMANKEATVAELTEKFESSTAVLLTEYRGLTVAKPGSWHVHQ